MSHQLIISSPARNTREYVLRNTYNIVSFFELFVVAVTFSLVSVSFRVCVCATDADWGRY